MSGTIAAVATIASAAVGAYSGYQQSKQQKAAAKAAAAGKTTTSSPYMAERINPVIPYIMSDAQKIYENRMRTYGMEPGDFSPIAAQLAGISPDYNGVGAAPYNQAGQSHTNAELAPRLAAQLGGAEPTDEELNAYVAKLRASRMGPSGGGGGLQQFQGRDYAPIEPGGGGGQGMGDLINYWDVNR